MADAAHGCEQLINQYPLTPRTTLGQPRIDRLAPWPDRAEDVYPTLSFDLLDPAQLVQYPMA
ncbi:hypothetical protein [Streptomyces syringium]|uniref:hypothetical protein n=1 Tax=Streptomyces syringium TaxID=76729 RepID=UPI0034052872